MISWRDENANTLASLLGNDTQEACRLLDVLLTIRFDESDRTAEAIANHLKALLARTVSAVRINAGHDPAAEIAIGSAPHSCTPAVRVSISEDAIHVGANAPRVAVPVNTPPIALLIAACYAAGMVLRAASGETLLVSGPFLAKGLTIPLRAALGPDRQWMSQECELTDTYLAGAGAIGNGFVYALTHLRVSGSLTIIDPDKVSDGNLNRCVWFREEDVGENKASRLCEMAALRLPRLKLTSAAETLQAFAKRQKDERWLNRLIVCVDSRRMRRRLQGEIPHEVFDASTTNAAEIVLHHHVQPTQAACMACIYEETADELARERHIAKALGVEIDDVKEHVVQAPAAQKIHGLYPRIPVEQIVGQAYDSLFKALCSQGALVLQESHETVVAPLAFVSALAGAYLALEMCRRLTLGPSACTFNYWRLSPWSAPVEQLKQMLPRNKKCEFCNQPILLRTAHDLWGSQEVK